MLVPTADPSTRATVHVPTCPTTRHPQPAHPPIRRPRRARKFPPTASALHWCIFSCTCPLSANICVYEFCRQIESRRVESGGGWQRGRGHQGATANASRITFDSITMDSPPARSFQNLALLERQQSALDSPASKRSGRRSLRSEPFFIGVAGGTASGRETAVRPRRRCADPAADQPAHPASCL